jgi:hypothetical protein
MLQGGYSMTVRVEHVPLVVSTLPCGTISPPGSSATSPLARCGVDVALMQSPSTPMLNWDIIAELQGGGLCI